MNNDITVSRPFIFYVASLLFFGVGGITTLGLDWYAKLALPWWTPPELLVAGVWLVLFFCTAYSASFFFEQAKREKTPFTLVLSLYAVNTFLILLWNYLFFGVHELGFAFATAVAVGLSVVALVVRLWREVRTSALLLIPYFVWMVFALAYTYTIMQMNP